ncbi:type II secretion system protein N [Sphaerotilus montanus]|jgi:general secretion pathway protein N|uniref:Type II secretion system protein N n=1 Tax=Sphaerotilus montanus TaxID=522889 RepID=A0A7Y9QX85_9BURK|nr:type II secretion system protein N [Sphaerotilus montanus]NYG31674.1 general secretion pathway protein N [Sphaerotilus montanus]NZD58209.1 type II secretion system protein N [Sphaerotilus montanus]
MALHGSPWRPTYQPSAHPSIFGTAARKPPGHGWVAQARASRRWAVVGAVVGATVALVAFAPAHWLAQAVASATQQRVLLANAQGTVWSGDAVLILGAGAGSRDARALPGRIRWTLRPSGMALRLGLQHDCCLNGEQLLLVRPGFGQVQVALQPGRAEQGDWVGQWPAAWLVGLGTPWNTLRPGGALRLTTQALSLSWAQGRFAMTGSAGLELRDFSSRLSTLPRLGSYRVTLSGDPAQAGTAMVTLDTLDGALRLNGSGSWSKGGLRLRGEATATDADRPALNNLLNIIGRRQGARSLLTIG